MFVTGNSKNINKSWEALITQTASTDSEESAHVSIVVSHLLSAPERDHAAQLCFSLYTYLSGEFDDFSQLCGTR